MQCYRFTLLPLITHICFSFELIKDKRRTYRRKQIRITVAIALIFLSALSQHKQQLRKAFIEEVYKNDK